MHISERYRIIRKRTEAICKPLKTEDYVAQPVQEISPPKWHIGHTTWFFEQFILKKFVPTYKIYNEDFGAIFNSYYESLGDRIARIDRGKLSRPTTEEIYNYRKYVDAAMLEFLENNINAEAISLVLLGFNHEEQHQELLCTDIKYILGHNPLFPIYSEEAQGISTLETDNSFITIPEGIYEIGCSGEGFYFDDESPKHKVFIEPFRIRGTLVTNREYLDFIDEGGYKNFSYWHSEGWDWVRENNIQSPMYWHKSDGVWVNYTFSGLQTILPDEPVCHVSYFEAYAFAQWKGLRLPTEFEWEIAAGKISWGQRWEWTESAFLPYPGFKKWKNEAGEYNAKFMINQMVLRGKSVVTPPDHTRITYRNFFHPHLRWQYTGIRLAESINV